MARTYTSEQKMTDYRTCETPYCGTVDKYFCVRCRHYVTFCRCSGPSGCSCPGPTVIQEKFWAGPGQRRMLRDKLAAAEGRR